MPLHVASWNEKYRKLEAFRRVHGHVNVQEKHDPKLYHWMYTQKRSYDVINKMTQERKAALDSIGFCQFFSRKDAPKSPAAPSRPRPAIAGKTIGTAPSTLNDENSLKWCRNFEELKLFRAANGNFKVSRREPLGEWAYNQKRALRDQTMKKERIDALNSIGFEWSSENRIAPKTMPEHSASMKSIYTDGQNLKWNQKFEELKLFKANNGHIKVSRGEPLGQWTRDQRRCYGLQKMKKERIDALNSIGFDWPRQKCGFPTATSEDTASVETVYTALATVENERNLEWNQKFEEVKLFKAKNGHLKFSSTESFSKWTHDQRRVYGLQKLQKERINALNSIGFEWSTQRRVATKTTPWQSGSIKSGQATLQKQVLRDLKWNRKFEELKQFRAESGHEKLPAEILRRWMYMQKHKCNQNKLKQERIDALNTIGFDWSIKGYLKRPPEDISCELVSNTDDYRPEPANIADPPGRPITCIPTHTTVCTVELRDVLAGLTNRTIDIPEAVERLKEMARIP